VIAVGILITGFVELIPAMHPTHSPSGAYGADGSSYISPPATATLWLSIMMTDVIVIMVLGIAIAFTERQ